MTISAQNTVLLQAIISHKQRMLHLACAGALLACGLALRLHMLQTESLWLDEFITWNELDRGSLSDYLAQLRTRDATFVPAYYVILHGWAWLTDYSVYLARLLSVAMGMTTALTAYLFALRLFSPAAGLIALALTALSPIHIYYTQEVRVYALYAMTALLSAYTLDLGLDRGGKRIWLLHQACNLLLAFSHYFGALFLITEGLYLLLFHRRPLRRLTAWFAAQAVIALLLGLWMLGIRRDVLEMTTAFLTAPPFKAFEHVFSWSAFYWPFALFSYLNLTRAVPLMLIALMAYCWRTRNKTPETRRRWNGTSLCLLLTVAPVLMTAAMTYLVHPAITVRYLLPASLPFFILLGGSAGMLPRPALRWSAAALIIALVAWHAWDAERPFRPNMQAAGRLIQELETQEQALLLPAGIDPLTLRTYFTYPEERLQRCPDQYDTPLKTADLLNTYPTVLMVCSFDYGRHFYSDVEVTIDAELDRLGILAEKHVVSDHHYTFITNQNWPMPSSGARRIVVYRMRRQHSAV